MSNCPSGKYISWEDVMDDNQPDYRQAQEAQEAQSWHEHNRYVLNQIGLVTKSIEMEKKRIKELTVRTDSVPF